VRERRYRRRLARGEPAGELRYAWTGWTPPPPGWALELRIPADAATPEAAEAWRRRQTLRELRVVGLAADGTVGWRVGDGDGGDGGDGDGAPGGTVEAPWFAAPGRLPDLDPAHLESALLVLAAEAIDAVALLPAGAGEPASEGELCAEPWRRWTLFRAGAYRHDPAEERVLPAPGRRLVKVLGPSGGADPPREAGVYGLHRRGPYLSSEPLGHRLEVPVRDAALLPRTPARPAPDRPALLVLSSFLARGGAEHTLHETLRVLRHRFEITIATLAPHRPELGDRRDDFRRLTPRLHCLGDLVHPAAMPGILGSLLDATGARILYNANGTTLFYDFAPGLKAREPSPRILDHLYDHRVGYVDRYDRELMKSVDACVAENRRIAEVLVAERGWPAERVPVIHPCGRARDAFPTPEEAPAVRRRLRRELGYGDGDVVLLTAARMHPQKRPLDLVALARRVRDLPHLHLLIAGGGELEAEVDAAVDAAVDEGARIRRLAFRTDVPELIVAADAGCLVSAYEGLPVFLLECLQAGRPFLGTDVGDMGELLRATGAGEIVESPGDLDALERALRRLADPDHRADLAEKARRAGRQLDPKRCAERYARAFLGQPVDGESG